MAEPIFELTEKQKQQIDEAASVLKKGGIVAFPTETVYGLGGDATNRQAIRRVYEVKQRPLNHPVIVHLADVSQLTDWAQNISTLAQTCIRHFWPGPLTLILRRTEKVLDEVTGGQETVAVRMPAHPIALALLEKTERPLIAPSANRFGHLSPTHSDHVQKNLGSEVNVIIEGGYCPVGIESTILDVSSQQPRILRLGAISPAQIEQVLGIKLLMYTMASSIRVPGALAQHYAPRTPFSVVISEQLMETIHQFRSAGERVAVLSQKPSVLSAEVDVFWFQMPSLSEDYMKMFYHALFLADQKGVGIILAESVPLEETWMAIRDRMERASHSS